MIIKSIMSCPQELLIVVLSTHMIMQALFDWFGNMVINAEVANVGKPNLCDWPRLWSASSLIGHVFKCGLDKERVDN